MQKAFTQVWKVELQVKSTAYKHKAHTTPIKYTKRWALHQLKRMAF